jgi:hypothetical protein
MDIEKGKGARRLYVLVNEERRRGEDLYMRRGEGVRRLYLYMRRGEEVSTCT